MLTGTLRNQIDKLWTEFWTGGITNPLTVIEQISFLMFARLLDLAEKLAARTKKPFKGQFAPEDQKLRWSNFKNLPAGPMPKLVRDEVFPHFRTLGDSESTFAEYMTDAQLLIQKPSLLVSAVDMIDALPLTEGDTKGNLYEYLLSKLTTAGINGQFRTPRHIIRLMVDLIEPKPNCNGSAWIGVCLRSGTRQDSPRRMIPRTSSASTPQPRRRSPPRARICRRRGRRPTSAARAASPPSSTAGRRNPLRTAPPPSRGSANAARPATRSRTARPLPCRRSASASTRSWPHPWGSPSG